MSEPTIEEMIEWLDEEMGHYTIPNCSYAIPKAIRAILEQHRDLTCVDCGIQITPDLKPMCRRCQPADIVYGKPKDE